MRQIYDKHISFVLLISIALFSLLAFVRCSNTNRSAIKRIVIVHSFQDNSLGYGNFNLLLKERFRDLNIEPEIRLFYLDCDNYDEKEEINHINNYLNTLDANNVDLIVAVNDPAGYSMLKTQHSILNRVPVILSNINFPNEEALDNFKDEDIFILRDTPDFKKNIELINTLHKTKNVRIVYNTDITFLGLKSFDLLKEVAKDYHFKIFNFTIDAQNPNLKDTISDIINNGKLQQINKQMQRYVQKPTIEMVPFRYMKGLSMLIVMAQLGYTTNDCVFLLDKFDITTRPMSQMLNIPTFSCVREGFDEKAKVLGGYIATETISADAVVDLACRIFNKDTVNVPKIQDLKKEYVIDWEVLTLYNKYKVADIPPYVRIINYPFTEKYASELKIASLIFVILFVVIGWILVTLIRKSRKAKKYTHDLQQVYDQLSLSILGGDVSSWVIKRGILEFDSNFTNLTGMQQTQYTVEEFIKMIKPEDRNNISNISPKDKISIRRVRLYFRNYEQERWVEIRFRSLVNSSGEVVMAGIMQDIQAFIEREQELIRAKEIAEAADMKQAFLTNISHEIRTPLNAIIGFTNILWSDDAVDLSQEDRIMMLDLVNENNDLLLKLIEDIVDISKMDTKNLELSIETLDVSNLTEDIYNSYRSHINSKLTFDLSLENSRGVIIETDRYYLSKVIINLLSNANKFTQQGFITLGCRFEQESNEVVIYVQDTGKGITPMQQEMVFDRFYKVDKFTQGIGLGLSICKLVVAELSGRIELESELGKGSCFSVILPINK